ncbi:MAG: CopG family antitoxin [Chlorobium sp.]
MTTEEFDKAFDECSDITSYLDLSKARRIKQQHKRVNVDFPLWMIESLDKEATRLGVSRQSVIKVWLGERLQQQKARTDLCVESALNIQYSTRLTIILSGIGNFDVFQPNTRQRDLYINRHPTPS